MKRLFWLKINAATWVDDDALYVIRRYEAGTAARWQAWSAYPGCRVSSLGEMPGLAKAKALAQARSDRVHREASS